MVLGTYLLFGSWDPEGNLATIQGVHCPEGLHTTCEDNGPTTSVAGGSAQL